MYLYEYTTGWNIKYRIVKMQDSQIIEAFLSIIGTKKEAEYYHDFIMATRVLHLRKNQKLVEYQNQSSAMSFIFKGSLVRKIINPRGEKRTIMFHTDGFHEFIKSYDSIYFHNHTDYEVIANEPTTIVSFDYLKIMEIVRSDLRLLNYFTEKTEELLMTLDLFRNYHLSLTSEEYLRWLYRNYNFIFLKFPSKEIASFMGITPVWLSKLKAKLNS
ncbi:hypothetical protein ASU31_00665 [Pedobacter ginsenosidimutans]|uniref:Cyclic nucleotide-binding domain-containing protein n=2 Tax=Pedobacter ginsenosidimutans TaxID=687842 RepID=A0A0T5VVJ6_9SPHI|nr:hypothetical protein ASU31_00665 [Pedobacter ginsenosidimutans]